MFAIEFEALAAEDAWRDRARCRDASGATTALFFSEQLDDIARAKAFCGPCPVRAECLAGALARREPWGVWGGELLAHGRVIANKRRRGRPPKVRPPEPVYDEWGRLVGTEERSASVA